MTALRRRPTRPPVLAIALGGALVALAVAGVIAGTRGDGEMLSAQEWASRRAGGTWTAVFGERDGASAVVLWMLALEVLSAAGLVVGAVVLRGLPDRGYALAKPLGLLLAAYPVWLAASLGVTGFSRGAVLFSVAAWLATALALAARHRAAVVAFARAHRRSIALTEAVFLGTFVAVLALRASNPDLFHPSHGGEKPMDLAFLTAVTKSSAMPPYDPWFAGGALNYYYFGQFLTAALVKGLAIRPDVAYNLAVPTWAAFTAVAALSLGRQLASLSPAAARSGPRTGVAGLLAAAFVLVAGNLAAAGQWAERLHDAGSEGAFAGPVGRTLDGAARWVSGSAELAPFDYWRPTREIAGPQSITEFPAFTLVYGDLHAHLMAMPLAMAAASLALLVLRGLARGEPALRRAGLLVLLGLLLGALYATNSWDMPTQVLLLAVAAVAGAWAARRAGSSSGARDLARAAGHVAVAGAWALAFFAPFAVRFEGHRSGVQATPQSTPPRELLVHLGLFLLPLLVLLARRVPRLGPTRGRQAAVMAAVVAVVVAGTLAGRSALAGLVCLGALLLVALRRDLRDGDGGRAGAWVLSLTAVAVLAAAEVFRLPEDLGRMNTVFKFWFQAWWLLAVAAAYAVWRLLGPDGPRSRRGRAAWLVPVAALALAAALFPLSAVPERAGERLGSGGPTLDGSAYMADAVYADQGETYPLAEDRRAIAWLRRTAEGTPVLLEGQVPEYRWGSRYAVYTGLPTVLGWRYHETQQRSDDAVVEERRQAIQAFYASADLAAMTRFLREHGVRYVVVGRLERRAYPAGGLEAVAALPMLEAAYEDGQTTVYEVGG